MAKIRAAGDSGASDRIRKAAIKLFKTHGYRGTPVRALADVVKIEAGSLYHHFPSKQQILFDNFERTMDDLLGGLQSAVVNEPTPAGCLRAAVRFHVLFHTKRQSEAFISHTEIRALTGENRRRVLLKRDRYEKKFCELLEAGVEAGAFHVADVRLTNIALLTMCSCVADWFSEKGKLTGEAVAERYVEMALKLVGYSDRAAPRTKRRSRRGLA